MAQERDIRYINREFSDFRGQLIEFAKNYFPDTYNDFSPTSPGMMFIEMASYVGDVLSFYQDSQLQETFLQHAKNPGNLYNLAYMMGYRPKVTSASEVELEISLTVNPNGSYLPDFTEAGILVENSIFKASSGNNTQFILQKPVNFNFSSSYDPTEVSITGISGGNPTEFTLTKKGKAYSAEIITTTATFDTVEKFATVTIDDEDIIGILSIEDDSSNIWYEVPFLGQDTVFVETANSESDSGLVPNNLTLLKTPRRFVTRFNSSGQLNIQFGSGITGDTDDEITPNPTNVGLGTAQGVSKIDIAYDPTNFLFTQTYGLAPPAGTTLTIKYLKGGGISANEDSNTIVTLSSAIVENNDVSNPITDRLSVTNPKPASGGRDGDTVEELRQNSLRSFNEQGRAVTLKDYAIRSLSMPPRFGSIAKAYATQDQLSNTQSNVDTLSNNPLAISLYTLSQDIDGKLTTASTSLKNNLKNYLSQYVMVTDSVTIKDAFIVNIGVQFEILPLPNYIGRDILLNCTNRLIEYFNISNWSINQPINFSPIFTLLDKVKGVQSVQKIKIINKTGTISGKTYSEYAYDVEGATRGNIVYPSLDPCIFEVKYPSTDIQGRITTL